MMKEKDEKFLTVAPFECAWRKDLKFQEAGRGCVAFDAFAQNDITLVFRENFGSQRYHYKRDNSPHYTVIIGSHRNRRWKIEVDGKTVVDVAGADLCSSSAFQSYWISVCDGLISIGKGRYPFQNLVIQWLDLSPNCSVQYVGLSSWDKHVGYRNVNVFPLTRNHMSLWKQVNCNEDADKLEVYEMSGLESFLESWDLSDMYFMVGMEGRAVPAHKVILQACGCFPLNSLVENVIQLEEVSYPILHALLQFLYTGRTRISEPQLCSLWKLSLQFEVMVLVKQCEEMMGWIKLNKKVFESGKKVELCSSGFQLHSCTIIPSEFPLNVQKLQEFYLTGKYADIDIYIEGHGLVARSHKIIMSLYSTPFTRMFTNGMCETSSSEACLRDVSPEAFKAMLEFIYSGELKIEATMNSGTLLLELLLLSDKFAISILHQECCKLLLEWLSEDSVYPILHVVSLIPSCKLIEETCVRKFAAHFDYCISANIDFTLMEEKTFRNIIQHPDLTVTSEERVLDAIFMWGMKATEVCGWEVLDSHVTNATPECLFKERLHVVNELLPFARLPLLTNPLLRKLDNSSFKRNMPVLGNLVMEAVQHVERGLVRPGNDDNSNVRFQHRQSSFKELQHISDGDSNGVMYFVGTSYGEHHWVNPVLAKRITITPSSPGSRYTDPKVLASRTYQGTSFAGPRKEDDGSISSWWMVDIGQNHQLMCNCYTLRQDGSRAYIRSWKLQGSVDERTWIDLRAHENEQTMCKPGQFASWPISGPSALLPLRFFRIILTGPTTDTSNPWNLCICFFELYGFFH